MPGTVYFDLETGSVEDLFTADYGYVRLCGALREGDDTTGITTDPARLLAVLERADRIVGHNIFRFDLMALAIHHGADYDALAAKAYDTYVAATVIDPPGSRGQKPWGAKGYYGMDQLAGRLGATGKTDDLPALAAEFGGYHLIPQQDRRYREYLRGDLNASRAVDRSLPGAMPPGISQEYLDREMRISHLQNRMTLSGWRVDVPLLRERARAEEDRRQASLRWLAENCGVPLVKQVGHGRGAARVFTEEPVLSPLATKEGRQALEDAFAAAGARHVPRTESGVLALSADAMGETTWMRGKGAAGKRYPGMVAAYRGNARVAEICGHVREVGGATAKYAEILNHVLGDRVHGHVGADQASGRWAMTKPSLTNLGKRGGKVVQRAPFLPDEGHVLLAADMDQVDMRGIAGLCQDPAYMALFAPGQDAHAMISDRVFGRHDGEWREYAKRIGHGWNYGMSVRGIANNGVQLELAEQFDAAMTEQFPGLVTWRSEVRERAEDGELLDNGFGRLMRCDRGRAWTQAPALEGQGCARDLVCTGLLRLVEAVPESVRWMRGVVHDEVVLSVPAKDAEEIGREIVKAMTFEWRGVPITSGLSRPGTDWAMCYQK
jgi:DNA polymerase family A